VGCSSTDFIIKYELMCASLLRRWIFFGVCETHSNERLIRGKRMGLGFEDTESRHALRAASCSLQPPTRSNISSILFLAYASNFVLVSHSLPWLELDLRQSVGRVKS
jgi:hypothetical protein